MAFYDEYEKVTISKFRGLYKRGLADQCPSDHAVCCENVIFNKMGEVSSRYGIAPSVYLAHNVTRMFLANNKGIQASLLTCDGNGNIYQDGNSSPLFSWAGMFDFAALNMFGYTFILGIMNTVSGTPPNLQIWDGTNPPRDAAGVAPVAASLAATTTGSGNVGVGVYSIAVSFVTASGFVTRPGPSTGGVFTAVTVTSAGNTTIALTGIPTGPTGTIARQILVTQGNQLLFFYLGANEGGFINDNTTTTATLNFFDTDLAISADSLFDQMEAIAGSNLTGTLARYHNRMFVVQFSTVVLASAISNAESIDEVTGFFQVDDQTDGNMVFALCTLQDVLYAVKFPGIFAVQDNGQEPAFWSIFLVDGGVGSAAQGISTLVGSESSASTAQQFLLSDLNGLYVFNGGIVRPVLTWKIDDIWKTINMRAFYNVTCFIDVYHDTIYILVPIYPSSSPNLLLVGDYSEGLDYQNIKWSIFTFPFTPSSIALLYYDGNMDGSDVYYYLRIAFYNNQYIYKMHAGYTDDLGAAINAYYQCYLASGSTTGNYNVFRVLRFRGKGLGNINILLDQEDFDLSKEINPPPLPITDPMSKDLDRQINFQNEKMSVGFGTGAFVNAGVVGEYFTVSRIDIFMKNMFKGRPIIE